MNTIRKIGCFYIDGFKEMTIGKTLWIIILCKVFVLFFVLKLFFFPNRLNALPDEVAKGAFVATDLIHRASGSSVGSSATNVGSSATNVGSSATNVGSPETNVGSSATNVGSPETLNANHSLNIQQHGKH